jgi:hypothetical protein
MMQPEKSYLVPGRIIDQQSILHAVELVVVTKQLFDEDETIFEFRLAQRSPVPDGGPYTLRYVFKEKKHEDKVRIKEGKLVKA